MLVRGIGAFVLGAFLALAAAPASAIPKSVHAVYGGSMNGMAIGVISEHFELDGGAYRIASDTRPIGLAAFVQRQPLRFTSRGHVAPEGLKPAQFEARRNAADPPQITAEFDWPASRLTLRHDGRIESLPLAAGTQDRLSVMYQFMFVRVDKLRAVEFSMTNGRKLDLYRYRVTPDVEIDTALGRLKTVHLVKQREAGDTAAEVWLSPQHHQLAVKMVIVERDGMRFEQNIQTLEIRD